MAILVARTSLALEVGMVVRQPEGDESVDFSG